MKKLAVCAILAMLICSISIGCLAAPAVISAYDGGTATGLMTVKKPETSVSSTTKQNYTLSAVCVSGATISLYSYNPADGQFYLKHDAYGAPLTKTVSASGVYLQQVDLARETNYLLLRAESAPGVYQHVRLDITLLDQSLLDSIRGFAANFRSIFGGW